MFFLIGAGLIVYGIYILAKNENMIGILLAMIGVVIIDVLGGVV